MNRPVRLLAVLLVAALAAGCSANSVKSAADDDDKIYVTGSRIPRNDRTAAGVSTIDDKYQIKDYAKPASRVVGGGSN